MAMMQAANRLQKALKKGGPTFGAWQMLPGSSHSRTLARSGVEWICIDTEHGNVDDGQMHEAVGTISSCNISPVVRIAANEPWMVKRALDAGAHGVVVPLLYTADDARRLVSSAKFPPQGTRGFGSPFPMASFGNPGPTASEYLQEANDALVTVVQIETKEALENVDEIAGVPGVDVLLVGPFDLGNNIGFPILDGAMAPELHDAIARVLGAAARAGKRTGIYCTSGQQGRTYAEMGFNMVSVAADMIAIPAYFASALAAAKGESGGGAKMTGPYGR